MNIGMKGENYIVGSLTVKRYNNGKEVGEHELASLILHHPLIDTIMQEVNGRIKNKAITKASQVIKESFDKIHSCEKMVENV